MQDHPIGIYDSGVGGLSVLKEIRKCLPHESIVYLADSANCPYGSMREAEALALARSRIGFLLDRGCKLVVIACNTVTAVAIDDVRSVYQVPFVGMEPALKPAAQQTRTGKIGVLATENTFNGRLFKETRKKHANGVQVIVQPGFGLVELVENGEQESDKAAVLLKKYLGPMMDQGADTLVLGCTHYPFLMNTIKQVTKNRMQVIDPSGAVAAQTKRVLADHHLGAADKTPSFFFYTTGGKDPVERILARTMAARPFCLEHIDI